jgi:glycosyltransferase involved in cell wall biosynthesis
MDQDPTISTFESRRGILFVAAFHKLMYYNGDAIWYFLQYVYPLVLQEATKPIPLVIAGKGIPKYLRDMVRGLGFEANVMFIESPKDLRPLYERARVFIAPHQYGAGVQYKVRYCYLMTFEPFTRFFQPGQSIPHI